MLVLCYFNINMSDPAVSKRNQKGSISKDTKTKGGEGTGVSSLDVFENDNICLVCRILVKDEGLACDVCGRWYHPPCQNVTDEEYAIVGKYSKFHWYCDLCDKKMAEIVKSFAKLEVRQDKLEATMKVTNVELGVVKEDVKSLKDQLIVCNEDCKETAEAVKEISNDVKTVKELVVSYETKINDICADKVKVSMEQIRVEQEAEPINRAEIMEELEIERRRLNLVIMKVPEEGKDEDIVKEIVTHLIGESGSSAIVEVERIGRLSGDGKARPLRVKLNQQNIRRDILHAAPKLKDNDTYKKIFVTPDLTRKQQAADKELRDKLKDFRKEDKEGDFKIKKGKIVKNEKGREVVVYPPLRK